MIPPVHRATISGDNDNIRGLTRDIPILTPDQGEVIGVDINGSGESINPSCEQEVEHDDIRRIHIHVRAHDCREVNRWPHIAVAHADIGHACNI